MVASVVTVADPDPKDLKLTSHGYMINFEKNFKKIINFFILLINLFFKQ